MPWRFLLSRLYLRGSTFVDSELCTLHGSHHFTVVFQSACPVFAPLCPFHPFFLAYLGLHKFKWTSLALQAQSRVDKVWFHPLPPPRVCVCVCADAGLRTVCTSCGCYLVAGSCWASPVHQSTSRQWVGVREQPCPLHIFAPPSVSTHPSPSVFFSSIFFFSPLSSLYFIRSPCSQRWT